MNLGHAVMEGADLLDDYVPGWANEINLAELDMKSNHSCIVGQLVKGHPEINTIIHTEVEQSGAELIEDALPFYHEYGFDAENDKYRTQYVNEETVQDDLWELRELWTLAILARLATDDNTGDQLEEELLCTS
jgi:hypothetical protein